MRRTNQVVALVLGITGWMLAGVFGVLACLQTLDRPHPELPWMLLASILLGLILAFIPVSILVVVSLGVLRGPQTDSHTTTSPATHPDAVPLSTAIAEPSRADGGPAVLIRPSDAAPPKATEPPARPAPLAQEPKRGFRWRWMAVAVICGLEPFVLLLTVFAMGMHRSTLLLTVPLNLVLVTSAVILGSSSNARIGSRVLCVLHLLGLGVATILAAWEIETVVWSGLVLAASGVAVAVVGARFQWPRIAFGLSAVVFAVSAFLVIAIGRFGPHEADQPLFFAMLAYQLAFVPLGLYVLRTSFVSAAEATRFELPALLLATLAVCLATSGVRVAASLDAETQLAQAIGIFLLNVIATATVAVVSARRTQVAASRSKLSCS